VIHCSPAKTSEAVDDSILKADGMDHSYEEIRSVVLDIIAKREKVRYEPSQFANLVAGVAEVFERRDGGPNQGHFSRDPHLSPNDNELVREIFWDLFLQRIVTLGCDNANRDFPWFKVSSQGKRILEGENPYIFHDVDSYSKLVRANVPTINETTLLYLQEAMQAFRAGCLLSATVMLGVASEHSFLALAEVAEQNLTYGGKFASVLKERTILQKFRKFRAAIQQHVVADLPPELKEDLEVQFDGILSVIRTFRNDAGHPSGKIMEREQVYVLLQMFIPYCKKLHGLIDFFKAP
jgi:hypothetical protein